MSYFMQGVTGVAASVFIAWASPAAGQQSPLQCTDGRSEVCTYCSHGTNCGEVPCVLLPLCDWVVEDAPMPRSRPKMIVTPFPLTPEWLRNATRTD